MHTHWCVCGCVRMQVWACACLIQTHYEKTFLVHILFLSSTYWDFLYYLQLKSLMPVNMYINIAAGLRVRNVYSNTYINSLLFYHILPCSILCLAYWFRIINSSQNLNASEWTCFYLQSLTDVKKSLVLQQKPLTNISKLYLIVLQTLFLVM